MRTREPFSTEPPQVLESSGMLKMTGTKLLNHMESSVCVCVCVCMCVVCVCVLCVCVCLKAKKLTKQSFTS